MAAISREVDRLNGVAEHYLRFARLPRPALEGLDLNELLGGLLDFLAPELAAAGVAVRRELAPDLPAVRGDEAQLRGALLNLLRNAREAMPGGGNITVRTRPIGGRRSGVEVRIGDTGGGIPPGDLTRIFEPFYSTKERGTGLGLAFTQQVMEEHGGSIQCQSELGRGTSFTLRFSRPPARGGGGGEREVTAQAAKEELERHMRTAEASDSRDEGEGAHAPRCGVTRGAAAGAHRPRAPGRGRAGARSTATVLGNGLRVLTARSPGSTPP